MNDLLLELIENYLLKINTGVLLIALKYEKELSFLSIIKAYKKGLIPKRGLLNRRCIFKFHGLGCEIKFSDCEVDFDFGPGGIIGGFNEYTLRKYIESLKDSSKFGILLNKNTLHTYFDRLIEDEIIYQPGFNRSSHLYYLKPTVTPRASKVMLPDVGSL